MAENFLQSARKSMESKGTVGAFTKSSQKAGEGVQAHAHNVMDDPSASTTQKRRAQFAINMKKIAERRHHGG